MLSLLAGMGWESRYLRALCVSRSFAAHRLALDNDSSQKVDAE